MPPVTPPPERPRLSPAVRRAGYVALVLMGALQIWALYLIVPTGGPDPLQRDKLVHVVMFAVPAALAAALRLRWVVLVLVLHALLSEPAQALFTRQRTADVWDTVADGVGIVIGVALARRVRGGKDRQLAGSGR